MSEDIKYLQQKVEQLEERCEYLERSNNRREDEIISLRDENVDLASKNKQLEKENKELNRMCELYGQSLYNADLTKAEKRVEQLENIRKEAVEYIKPYLATVNWIQFTKKQKLELLNILNKGSEE